MISSELKLKEGDIIVVHGWVMLNKLDEGSYRVAKISNQHGQQIYDFSRPNGKKIIIRHYADNVDPWVKDQSNPDINKIVKQEA